MFGFFKRKPLASGLHGDSPEDWRAGDIAECIHDGRWFEGAMRPAAGPRKGARNKVICVKVKPHLLTGKPVQLLQFSRFPGFYIATGFRKVRPQADAKIAGESNWLSLLLDNRSRRRDREDA